MKSILITIFMFLTFPVTAEEYFSYSKVEKFNNETKITTGILIKYDNKVETKAGVIYSLRTHAKGIVIETVIPIGRRP